MWCKEVVGSAGLEPATHGLQGNKDMLLEY